MKRDTSTKITNIDIRRVTHKENANFCKIMLSGDYFDDPLYLKRVIMALGLDPPFDFYEFVKDSKNREEFENRVVNFFSFRDIKEFKEYYEKE